MPEITVHHGDSRDVLKGVPDASVDSVVCDPPYALVSIDKRFGKPGSAPAKSGGASGVYARASAGFMGQQWDTGETAFAVEFWAEVFRVLKPGAHVVAFSGTRTYHRMACAIEDAGFEIRDQAAWAYGSGFPKSHDVSKAIDKHLGCERAKVRVPASQVRNPKVTGAGRDGTVGATRPWIEKALEAGFHEAASPEAASWSGWGTALKPAWEPICVARKPLIGSVAANVLEHGTGALNIDGCRVETDEDRRRPSSGGDNGLSGSGTFKIRERKVEDQSPTTGRWPANIVHDGSDEVVDAFPAAPGQQRPVTGEERSHRTKNAYGDFGASQDGFEPRADEGSAARFFYSAKADAEDRLGSKHPTVKPIDLMRWLCRLVTPPGGLVLDPFAGSGTTGVAAYLEGFDAILIEREEQYVADINRRVAWVKGQGALTAKEIERAPAKEEPLGGLFADLSDEEAA